MKTTVLLLPGIGDSGPDHWQSLWEKANPSIVRVRQRDWDRPICEEWLQALDEMVAKIGGNAVLAAHSLGCLLAAHWIVRSRSAVQGALLVAPPNPDGPEFPKEAVGFSPVPKQAFGFPSIVVASADDPYASLEFAKDCAARWGSRFVHAGAVGHINAASGLGQWREGFSLLQSLIA